MEQFNPYPKVEELKDTSQLKLRNDEVLTDLAEEYKFLSNHSVQRSH